MELEIFVLSFSESRHIVYYPQNICCRCCDIMPSSCTVRVRVPTPLSLRSLLIRCDGLRRNEVVTARKRSCGKVMFLHLSVILFTGGVYTWSHPSDTHTWTHPRTPPGHTHTTTKVNKRAVRITLECFLVLYYLRFFTLYESDFFL